MSSKKMKNNERIKSIISAFSGRDNIISYPKVYVILTEDFNTALLLNQIVYWSDRTKRQDGYFYKSYKEWNEEIMLSKYQVKRAATKLEQLGLISTKTKGVNNAPTLHYKAHMDEIEKMIMDTLNPDDDDDSSQSEEVSLRGKETSLSQSKEVSLRGKEGSLSQSEEDLLSTITVDYLTDDYTDDYNTDDGVDVGVVFDTFSELGFGTINGYTAEQIAEWSKIFEPKVIIKAMKLASNNNKRTMSYVNGILKNWKNEGLIKLEDIEAEEKSKELNRQSRSKNVSSGLTDEQREQYSDLGF